MRAQSPSNTRQYHCSPTRHRSNLLNDDRKAEDKKVEKHSEQSKEETAVKKNTDNNITNLSSQAEKNVVNTEATKPGSSKVDTINKHLRGDSAERNLSPDRRDNMSPRVESSEKRTQNNAQDGDKKKGELYTNNLTLNQVLGWSNTSLSLTESEPCASAAKMAAGTTNAEEATRVLAERRRQARAQKELEDEKRKQEEEERWVIRMNHEFKIPLNDRGGGWGQLYKQGLISVSACRSELRKSSGGSNWHSKSSGSRRRRLNKWRRRQKLRKSWNKKKTNKRRRSRRRSYRPRWKKR